MTACSYNFIKFSMCSYNFNVAVRISINLGKRQVKKYMPGEHILE